MAKTTFYNVAIALVVAVGSFTYGFGTVDACRL